MATKLKGLKVQRIALVDEGANPDAHIRFAKRNDEQQATPETEPQQQPQDERSFAKRLIDAIGKAFGVSPADISKTDAQTFTEAQDAQKWDKIAGEAADITWLFTDSVRSILYDDEADAATKAQKLKQSLQEFTAAFDAAIPQWAQGASAEIKTDAAVVIAIKRNILETLQAETQPTQPTTKTTTPSTDDADSASTVTKGEPDMKFDTTKMTPEERATFDDLAKRYGAAEEAKPAETPAPAEDVSKAIAPEVKEELEALRKYKAEAEERSFTEVAKKYELLGKKPEDLAPVLKSLKQLGDAQYDGFIAVLDSNLAALEKSAAFDEIGKRGGQADVNDAWSKIELAAQEIVKNKPSLTMVQAIDQACADHPELLQQYEKSRA